MNLAQNTGYRLLKLARYLHQGGLLSTHYIQRRFQVSRATAKRDLVLIEAALPVDVRFIEEGKIVRLPRDACFIEEGKIVSGPGDAS